MSVPGIHISCDRCDYLWSTVTTFGPFKYITPRGMISLPRCVGWCETCRSVAPIEEVSKEKRMKLLISDLNAVMVEIRHERKEAIKNTLFLKCLFGTNQTKSGAMNELKGRAKWLSSELFAPNLLAKYLACSRKPICLSCGSFEVQKLPPMPEGLSDFYDKKRVKLPIGMRHPGSGGELLARTSEFRFFMFFDDRIYDLDGKKIA